jgi:hypothetical protein
MYAHSCHCCSPVDSTAANSLKEAASTAGIELLLLLPWCMVSFRASLTFWTSFSSSSLLYDAFVLIGCLACVDWSFVEVHTTALPNALAVSAQVMETNFWESFKHS